MPWYTVTTDTSVRAGQISAHIDISQNYTHEVFNCRFAARQQLTQLSPSPLLFGNFPRVHGV